MGVQILSKDVSLISSIGGIAKASIGNVEGITGWAGGGGGFQPGDFDFVFLSGTMGQSNTVTFTKTATLYLQLDASTEPNYMSITGYVNSSTLANVIRWYTTEADAILYKQTETITNFSDPRLTGYVGSSRRYAVIDIITSNTLTLQFSYDGDPSIASGTILSFKNSGFAGTVVDTLVGSRPGGCYLTTATVQFKGLLDDGPELTAMRILREHYRGDIYYDNLITEYYINSQAIIDGINTSADPAIDYEYIYQSVLRVKDFVDNNQWEEAKDEYINTYLILKAKYIL